VPGLPHPKKKKKGGKKRSKDIHRDIGTDAEKAIRKEKKEGGGLGPSLPLMEDLRQGEGGREKKEELLFVPFASLAVEERGRKRKGGGEKAQFILSLGGH